MKLHNKICTQTIKWRFLVLFVLLCSVLIRTVLGWRTALQLHIDSVFSMQAHQLITKIVQHHKTDFCTNTSIVALKNKLPACQAISFSYDSAHHAIVRIQAHVPYVRLNDKFVIANDACVYSSNLFENALINNLPTLYLSDTMLSLVSNDIAMASKMCTISKTFSNDYTIRLHAIEHIELFSKQHENFSVTATLDNLITTRTLQLITVVIAQPWTQQHIKNNNTKKLTADIRFKNQVVMSTN